MINDFDLLKEMDEIQSNFDFNLPIPSKNDKRIISLIKKILLSDKKSIVNFISKFDFNFTDTLAAFGVRMASLAVRYKNVDDLIIGFQALSFAAKYEIKDEREIIMDLSVFNDAAKRLKIKLEDIRDKIYFNNDFNLTINNFINSKNKDKTLKVMRYHYIKNERGEFVYEPIDKMSFEEFLKYRKKPI